jgi:rod shape-determining protein MreC
MKNLLKFLYKNYHFFLFILLEVISIAFIVQYNQFQRTKFLSSSNKLAGDVYANISLVKDFFSLRKQNELLAIENANLTSEVLSLRQKLETVPVAHSSDSTYVRVTAAKVINNSVNKQYNYLTLNKGSRHGIKPDMGVICQDGVVGVVVNVSQNYSTVLSLLNSRWSINAKLRNSNHFGPLSWGGNNPYMATLFEIPYHVKVDMEDEVVTSGYSDIFPEGILIGKVVRLEQAKGKNFQEIRVQLSTDFNNLYYVDVIKSSINLEKQQLEKLNSDE